MSSIGISENAFRSLQNSYFFYESQRSDLSARFFQDWEYTLAQIAQSPYSYQIKQKQFRSIVFETFPFLIIYKIYKEEVVVHHVIHAQRKPARRYI